MAVALAIFTGHLFKTARGESQGVKRFFFSLAPNLVFLFCPRWMRDGIFVNGLDSLCELRNSLCTTSRLLALVDRERERRIHTRCAPAINIRFWSARLATSKQMHLSLLLHQVYKWNFWTLKLAAVGGFLQVSLSQPFHFIVSLVFWAAGSAMMAEGVKGWKKQQISVCKRNNWVNFISKWLFLLIQHFKLNKNITQ